MILPDFLDFEPFNLLRQSMGAKELGQFEFFDPQLHLTAEELNALGSEGLRVSLAAVRALADSTLAYKNSRVLLYSLGQAAEPVYHLANCDCLQRARSDNSTAQWGVAVVTPQRACRVCPACLQAVQYQSFDAVRSRHREYSQRVQENFSLRDFFKRYPCYPLQERPVEHTF